MNGFGNWTGKLFLDERRIWTFRWFMNKGHNMKTNMFMFYCYNYVDLFQLNWA